MKKCVICGKVNKNSICNECLDELPISVNRWSLRALSSTREQPKELKPKHSDTEDE